MVNIPLPPQKKNSKGLGAISPNDAQTFQIHGVCPISTSLHAQKDFYQNLSLYYRFKKFTFNIGIKVLFFNKIFYFTYIIGVINNVLKSKLIEKFN